MDAVMTIEFISCLAFFTAVFALVAVFRGLAFRVLAHYDLIRISAASKNYLYFNGIKIICYYFK